MQQIGNTLSAILASLLSLLPSLILGLVLILVAWIIARVVRGAINKGLLALNLDEKMVEWNVAQSEETASQTIQSVANVFYYLVWVLFLPGILNSFGLSSVAGPVQNMIDTALSYIPNIFGAIIIFVIGLFVAQFVKNLVYNLVVSLNLDGLINRFVGNKEEQADAPDRTSEKRTIANVSSMIVYVLVLFPIATAALDVLGIEAISNPINALLNSILSAIPNILIAIILISVGFVIAKFISELVTDLLESANINRLLDYVDASDKNINLANIIGQVVGAIIIFFFVVEAMNSLNLEILNTVGAALISYLPNIIFAIIILGAGLLGGQFLGKLVAQSTQSKWLGEIIKYLVLILAIFMTLDQLNIASNIVNIAFLFIVAGLAIAFAVAFGIGGRDFAAKQLDRLDKKMNKEISASSSEEDSANK